MAHTTKDKVKKWLQKTFKHPIVTQSIATLVSAALLSIIGGLIGLFKLPAEIAQMEARLGNIEEKILEIDAVNTEEKFLNITKEVENINSRINRIEDKLWDSIALKLVPTKASISNFSVVYETDKGIYCLNQPKWKSSDVIAIDLNSNIEYTAADLINEKLILTYEIEDSDIIFCGQFDENNNWNGQCIINVYNNGLLSLATEAEYNSGELLSYKQILPTSIAGGDVWIVSDRIHDGDFNNGENFCYKRDSDYSFNPSSDDITAEDIITAENLRDHIDLGVLQSYYSGKTSMGNYNDQSGKALFIEYFPNGTVKTLYKGGFRDGKFEDTTGKAWYIVREENTLYMYYQGNFKNGKPTHNNGYIFKNDIDNKEIEEILHSEEIYEELIWYDGNA